MRPRTARLLALFPFLLLFASLFPAGTGRAADDGGFTVGILRRDGIVIPFATFDGRRWTNRWPVEQATNVPIGLGDVPKGWWQNGTIASEWRAWPVGGASQPIKALAPVVVPVHCMRRVALRTDYTSIEPPPPPEAQPYPKNGLATAGNVTVEPIQVMKTDSPEAAAVIASVQSSVAEAENNRVRAWARAWTHPLGEKDRAKVPFSLEVLARTPGLEAGSSAYYFEGVKKYPGFLQYAFRGTKPDREMCDYLTFAGGWFLSGAKAEASKASVGAELTNCNRQGLAYTLPLGAIRAAGRLFWILQTSSWNYERYEVVEIREKDVKPALSVGGGGCPDQ